jgi:GNAT superfamily N-acetyltransferase
MDDSPLEFRRDSLVVSTDRGRLDRNLVLRLLQTTPWAGDLTPAVLARAINNSVCFGLFEGRSLVGFGRVVTDLATYAYWTDVVIAEDRRGRGLGRWLSECMLAHPDLQGLRRVALLTRDAQRLYAQMGFTVGPGFLTYMEWRP